MRANPFAAIRAFALVLVLLNGAVVLPAVDVALFHPASGRTHGAEVDSDRGGQWLHAEHCALAAAATCVALVAHAATEILAPAPVAHVERPSSDRVVPTLPNRLSNPRAPPLRLA